MSLKNNFFKYIETLNYHSVLKNLVSRGLNIKIVYDIGAHKGRWAKQHAGLLPNASFYLFEASKEHAEKLKSRGHRTFIGVLSSDGEPTKFYKRLAPAILSIAKTHRSTPKILSKSLRQGH